MASFVGAAQVAARLCYAFPYERREDGQVTWCVRSLMPGFGNLRRAMYGTREEAEKA